MDPIQSKKIGLEFKHELEEIVLIAPGCQWMVKLDQIATNWSKDWSPIFPYLITFGRKIGTFYLATSIY